ncbi:3-oxoadipate--succinyl-CoA transferase subunit B [Candidatus Bathyarchaeota archaeon]|nr:3-oxoadipate--succinyl-CoA transferase subunit B [Candidatus Bathyarchaeota archaeon]
MNKKYAETSEFTTLELMAVCGSKQIKNGEVIFIGTGLPLIAAMLAKQTHAPGAKIVYEAGFIDSNAKDIALSIADSRLGYHAAAAIGLIETLGLMLQGGHVDVGFVGAAQIDEYGNINTTYIGSYEKPTVRLPGSGGGNDIISSAKRVVVIMTHEKRKMVKKLDYLTSPGFLDGPGARERVGLLGGGPSLVVTNLCQMDFDPKTKRIRLVTVHPGVTVDQVMENSGFDLIIPRDVPTTEAPTHDELTLLRAIDPSGIYIPRVK